MMPLKSSTNHLKHFNGIFLKRIAPPACSRLYGIDPINVDTPQVESLTSYIVRLASAHCVTVGALITLEIAPLINKSYILDHTSTTISSPFILNSRMVNGLGVTAAKWANALQALTLQERFHFMTVLPLKEWISKNTLLRTFRAWCPDCYEEWHQAKEVIYDPLLWSLNVVTACLKHKRFLLCQCVHCNRQLTFLTRLIRHGFCPYCKQWLGVTTGTSSKEEILNTDQLRWQTWVFDQLGTILGTASQLSCLPERRVVSELVSACVQKTTRGNLKAFIQRFRSFNSRTIDTWRLGRSLPELGSLLNLCYQTEVSMKDILLGKIGIEDLLLGTNSFEKSDSYNTTTAKLERTRVALLSIINETPPPSLSAVANRFGWYVDTFKRYFPDFFSIIKERHSTYEAERFDREKIKSFLMTAICDTPPPSLHSIAKRLGCSPGFLRLHFPTDTSIIVERHMEFRKVFVDVDSVRDQFQALLTEYPPLSITQCADRLGYKYMQLYTYFPDICRTAGARYFEYQKENARQRRESRQEAIINTKGDLEAEGISPSYYHIRKRLLHISGLTNREIDSALNGLRDDHKQPYLESFLEININPHQEPLETQQLEAVLKVYPGPRFR